MTPQEALDTFGSTIPFKFFNGTGYTDSTFSYYGLYTEPITVYSSGDSYTYQGTTFLEYHSPDVEETTNPNYITVDIAPSSTINNTMQIHTVIALSDGYNANSYTSTIYQSPSWDWFYDGTNYHLENSDLRADGSGQYAYLRTSGAARNFLYVCADFTAVSPTYGYTTRATFSGNAAPYQNPIYRLLIGVPYVDSLAEGQTGIVTTPGGGGGGGDINVNVTVDNSGVESRLDDVNSGIADINSALYGQSGGTMPYLDSMENPEYHFDGSTIDDIDQTLRDVPSVISSAAWWWNLAFDVLHLDSAIWSLVPLLCILSLVSYMLWRW